MSCSIAFRRESTSTDDAETGLDGVIDWVNVSESSDPNNRVDPSSAAPIDNMLVRTVFKALPHTSLIDSHFVCHGGGDVDSSKLSDVEKQYGDIREFPRVKVASGVKLGQLLFELEDCLPDGAVGKGPVGPLTNKLLDIGYCPR